MHRLQSQRYAPTRNAKRRKLIVPRTNSDSTAENRCFEIVRCGRVGCRLTNQSIFSVAVRKSMSNIATADFGAVILDNKP
jgi:hypothetical protein